jgi:hypothetical protein
VEKLLHTGPIFVVERGVEAAESHGEVMVYALAENLIRLGHAAKDAGLLVTAESWIDTKQLYEALTARYYDSYRHLKPEFLVLNVVDDMLNTVGTIVSGSVEITGEIVFPGGTKIVPKNS